MKFQEVESSNIHAMAHDKDTMQVQFKTGALYEYDNVKVSTYHEIVNATSVGSSFNRLVKSKPDAYPYRRLS